MLKVWDRKPPTREMLGERRKQIEEQRALLDLEIEIEAEAVAFQEHKLNWLEGRLSLKDILNDDSWSLCKKISKLKGENDVRESRNPFKARQPGE